MLARADEDLWTRSSPLKLLGLHLGTRMTVVRLPDGGLWIHSPVPLDASLKHEVDRLGPVRHIVCPNLYHHLSAGAWANAYPDALVYAPAGLRKKQPTLRIDASLSDVTSDTWQGALLPVPIDGCLLGETVFVHPETRSVISADLLENFVSTDHFPTELYLKVCGIYRKPGLASWLRLMFRDRAAAQHSLRRLLDHDFERVVLSHGEVLERGGPEVLKATYAFLKR